MAVLPKSLLKKKKQFRGKASGILMFLAKQFKNYFNLSFIVLVLAWHIQSF